MTEYTKPLPTVSPESQVFWDRCREHQLWLKHCDECDRTHFYPRDICPHCGARTSTWRQASGRAALYTFSVVYRAAMPAFRDDVPFVTAIVELEEGPRMATNLVGIEPDPKVIKVGMPLVVTFDDVTPEVTLPKFRPA